MQMAAKGPKALMRSVPDFPVAEFRREISSVANRSRTVPYVGTFLLQPSQIHTGCGGRLVAPRWRAKQLGSTVTNTEVDWDIDATLDLCDWPDYARPGSVGVRTFVSTNTADDDRKYPDSGQVLPHAHRNYRKLHLQGEVA